MFDISKRRVFISVIAFLTFVEGCTPEKYDEDNRPMESNSNNPKINFNEGDEEVNPPNGD